MRRGNLVPPVRTSAPVNMHAVIRAVGWLGVAWTFDRGDGRSCVWLHLGSLAPQQRGFANSSGPNDDSLVMCLHKNQNFTIPYVII